MVTKGAVGGELPAGVAPEKNISIYRIPHSVRNPPLRAIYNSILQLRY